MSEKPKKDKAAEAETNAQKKEAEGQESEAREAEVKADQVAAADGAAKKVSGRKAPVLKPVAAWIAEKRLASWQSAALLRGLGWTEDKQVDEEEFIVGLAQAMSRRQGGHKGGKNSGRRN
jgi:hypothetical protein